jgi:UrcA family protein
MKAHISHSVSLLLLIFGLAATATGRESPVDRDDAQRRTVSAIGLDVERLPDAETLYRRIRTAAQSACRAQRALWDGKRVLHHKRCVERAVEDAVLRAEQPLLTTVHRSFGERLAER